MTESTLHVARSVERALALLELVVTSDGVTLTDAARASGVPTSTALRHLKALEQGGYVERSEAGSFHAGPKFVRLALIALERGPTARLVQLARPVLATLEEETRETAYLAVAETTTHAVYVAAHESRRALRHVGWLGSPIPRSDTAVGEALSGSVAAGVAVHRTGVVEADVTAVATPVWDGATVVAALAVIGPVARLSGPSLEAARAAVARAGRSLSNEEVAV